MCFDILEKKEIVTYREKDHDFLMEIRNGKYLDSSNNVNEGFFDLIREYERRFEYDKENTDLPDKPDINRINELVMSVNETVVCGLPQG